MKRTEMKKKKPTMQFGTALAAVNVLALIYPISLLVRAESVGENLFATFALIGLVFLLVVVDAVGIVVADTVSTTRC